jgi:hypothetical protein
MDDHIHVCCIECFDDYAIKEYIIGNEVKGNCDFCGSKSVNICKTDDVKKFIEKGFLRKYEHAGEHIAFESREGGYQYPTSFMDELLSDTEMIFSYTLDDPTELLQYLVTYDNTPYVRQDPYGPTSGGYEDISMWNEFCKLVKYRRRFTNFYEFETETEKNSIDASDDPTYPF